MQCFVVRRINYYKDVQVNTRDKSGKEWVPLLSTLLIDNTGVIELTAWRNEATRIQATLQENFGVFEDHEEEDYNLVEISHFEIRDAGSKCIGNIKKLCTISSTLVKRIETGSMPSVQDSMLPPSDAGFVKEFAALEHEEPDYMVNLIGIISSCGGETPTVNGSSMRSFQLVDPSGCFIACTAMGHLASSEFIQERSKVMIYFASAKRGLGDRKGCFWLYSNAHIVRIGEAQPARNRKEIILRGAQQ